MMRTLLAFLVCFWTCIAFAQYASNGSQPSLYVCQSTSVPAGNTVTNTTTETPFASTCFVPANRLNYLGATLNLKTTGSLGVAATIPSLQGRILAVQDTGSPVPCTTANKCVVLLDTGATAGLTAGSGLRWDSDSTLKLVVGGTTATGRLDFQTGATAGISVFASTSTGPTPTYAAVDWTVNETIYYTATWGAAATANYIQVLTMDGR